MPEQWLVFSDMDGTLLNHHDYRVEAAMPMLKQLEEDHIPVIFNTSKTFAELSSLVKQLNNRHPFIVENGSAIAVPEDYFDASFQRQEFAQARQHSGYRVIVKGCDIQSINSYLEEEQPDAINFVQCSIEEAIQLTGLSASEVRAAQSRQYSVPLCFADRQLEKEFSAKAVSAGFGILKGGRFLHVLGRCDKGSSMLYLKQVYARFCGKTMTVIALGDSQNDEDMLEQSDVAVIVKSPSNAEIHLCRNEPIYTQEYAPEGWSEGVKLALQQNL
jgi:mannosyl-3-phosphoglycerate phosphatase family protein